MIKVKILSVLGRYLYLIWAKKWEGSVDSSSLKVYNMKFTLHNTKFLQITTKIDSEKSRKKEVRSQYKISTWIIKISIFINSQIVDVNLKMIGEVLVLRKCYQCGGGDTLVKPW